jgi:DNA-binding transcriptional ArsR family regulator
MNLSKISPMEKTRIIMACLSSQEVLAELVSKLTPEETDRITLAILNDQHNTIHMTIGGTPTEAPLPIKLKTTPKMAKMAALISNLPESSRETFEIIQAKGPILREKLNSLHDGVTDGAVGARLYSLMKLGLVEAKMEEGSKVNKVYSTNYVPSNGTPTKTAGAALMSLQEA